MMETEGANTPSLQDAFKALLAKRKAIQKRNKAVTKQTKAAQLDRSSEVKARLRDKFLSTCLSYQGARNCCSNDGGAVVIAHRAHHARIVSV